MSLVHPYRCTFQKVIHWVHFVVFFPSRNHAGLLVDWCYMMLYDVIWCYMMLYDVIDYTMGVSENMVLPNPVSSFFPFRKTTICGIYNNIPHFQVHTHISVLQWDLFKLRQTVFTFCTSLAAGTARGTCNVVQSATPWSECNCGDLPTMSGVPWQPPIGGFLKLGDPHVTIDFNPKIV